MTRGNKHPHSKGGQRKNTSSRGEGDAPIGKQIRKNNKIKEFCLIDKKDSWKKIYGTKRRIGTRERVKGNFARGESGQ